ncbi:hypothetical protein DEJ31_16775, partial [Curtobacterium sp. MCPF17_031]
GLWALGSGLWALGSGLWALGSGLWALGSGLWALGSGPMIAVFLDDRNDQKLPRSDTKPLSPAPRFTSAVAVTVEHLTAGCGRTGRRPFRDTVRLEQQHESAREDQGWTARCELRL